MKTEVSTDREAAVELLRTGEIVALPTETVYGLAADALNAQAVAKIFEAKERPRFDPLIVHLPNQDWLERVADISTQDRQLVLQLIDRFWPGPFTVVLPKKPIIPDIVTAGLDTVAIRVSAHPVFNEVVRALDRPLAAPSANRFGRVSPTVARHVLTELDGRIPLIVDAGPTTHGIESTIVTVRDGKIDILRRGPIAREDLSKFGKVDIAAAGEKISAPGQLPTHYAPRTPMRLIENADSYAPALEENQRAGLLAWNPRKIDKRFVAIRNLSERQDLVEAAANLFCCLRELDAMDDVDLIVAEQVPDRGLGAAIMDRLRRAAHRDAPGKPERIP